MDTTREIQQLNHQIAENERTVEANADLREKRAALVAAEHAAEEAAIFARAAEEKAAAVVDAAHAARRAEVPPLKAELAAIEEQLAAVDASARKHLHAAVEACRALHAERERLVREHDVRRGKLSGHGQWFQRFNPTGFAAFLRAHLAHVVG